LLHCFDDLEAGKSREISETRFAASERLLASFNELPIAVIKPIEPVGGPCPKERHDAGS
jgi:hypothetical protein